MTTDELIVRLQKLDPLGALSVGFVASDNSNAYFDVGDVVLNQDGSVVLE